MRQVVRSLLLVPFLLLGCRETINQVPVEPRLECSENERIIDGACTFVCDRDSDCQEGQRCNLFTGVCVPDTTEPEPENPPVPCTAGARRCSGNSKAVERCNENGVWTTIRTCAADGFCLNEECLDCEPGKSTCKANDPDTLVICDDLGSDTYEFDCSLGATCHDGQCGECTEGETRCSPDGTAIQICRRTADRGFRMKWENTGDEGDRCITDQCVVENGVPRCTPAECYPGDQQCDGPTAQLLCNDSGHFVRQECSTLPNFTANAKCENDRCVDECGTAVAQKSYFGCDYWTYVGDNLVSQYFKGGTASGQGTTASEFAFVVANNSLQPATVTITRWKGNAVETVATVTVPSRNDATTRGLTTVKVPWQSLGAASNGDSTTGKARFAYRVQSTKPITLYQFNPLTPVKKSTTTCGGFSICPTIQGASGECESGVCNYYTYSNDASLVLPAHILGNTYVAITNEHHPYSSNGNTASSTDAMDAYVGIVATEADTQVTIKNTGAVKASPGTLPSGVSAYAAMAKNQTRTVTLNQYEVLQLGSGNSPDAITNCESTPNGLGYYCRQNNDLSGTVITSNKPIAVFGGSACINKPVSKWACDHAEEQIFPFSTWGSDFIAVQSAPLRVNASTFCSATQAAPDFFKIVSGCPSGSAECPLGTQIVLSEPPTSASDIIANNCEAGTSLLTNDCILKGIKTLEFRVRKSGAPNNFRVTSRQPTGVADKPAPPISVMQFFSGQNASDTCDAEQGDPSMVLLPPIEQWRASYNVLAAPGLKDNYLGLSWDSALVKEIHVDGVAISLTGAKSIPGGTYRVLNQKVTDGAHSIEVIPKPGLSVIPGAGVIVYGFDDYVSYGYAGGLDLKQIVTTIDPGG